MNFKLTKTFLVVISSMLFTAYAGTAVAQESEPLLNFKFNHLISTPASLYVNNNANNFKQYDATWTYPWETKSVNIDVGMTLRHLSGYQNIKSEENISNTYFQEVLPLLHASALFSLPVEGLSAGIEGSHLYSSDSRVLDYRAKISYEWRKGFGLQGGWQHQQFSLDAAANSGADYKKDGAFIDFYLNF